MRGIVDENIIPDQFSYLSVAVCEKLDICENRHVVGSGLGKVVNKLHVKKLEMRGCEITNEELNEFCDELDTQSVAVCEVLNINRNPHGVGSGLGKVVNKLHVKKLEMRGCKITNEELNEFCDELDTQSVAVCEELDISENPHAVGSGLGKVVNKLHVKKLWMQDCNITNEELNEFCDELDTQLEYIGMQYNDVWMEMIPAVEKLMSHVRGEMRISPGLCGEGVLDELTEVSNRYNECQVRFWLY